MKHVAVLMGGWSSERQVSLWSGTACADALERTGRYKVSRVDVDREVAAALRALKPDCALNVLHGRPGEDGLGSLAQLPDCGAAYEAEKKRTPDYAKEIEQLPSVISYPVTATFDGTAVSYVARAGETSCRVPD